MICLKEVVVVAFVDEGVCASRATTTFLGQVVFLIIIEHILVFTRVAAWTFLVLVSIIIVVRLRHFICVVIELETVNIAVLLVLSLFVVEVLLVLLLLLKELMALPSFIKLSDVEFL